MLEHDWLHVRRAKVSIILQPEPHPFATSMADFLLESGRRANRASLVQAMMTGTNAKYECNLLGTHSLPAPASTAPLSPPSTFFHASTRSLHVVWSTGLWQVLKFKQTLDHQRVTRMFPR